VSSEQEAVSRKQGAVSREQEAREAFFSSLFTAQCSLVTGYPPEREGIIPAKGGKLNEPIIVASMPGRELFQ
jgi:hypothetical protein